MEQVKRECSASSVLHSLGSREGALETCNLEAVGLQVALQKCATNFSGGVVPVQSAAGLSASPGLTLVSVSSLAPMLHSRAVAITPHSQAAGTRAVGTECPYHWGRSWGALQELALSCFPLHKGEED